MPSYLKTLFENVAWPDRMRGLVHTGKLVHRVVLVVSQFLLWLEPLGRNMGLRLALLSPLLFVAIPRLLTFLYRLLPFFKSKWKQILLAMFIYYPAHNFGAAVKAYNCIHHYDEHKVQCDS